jgi:hypothetical protein
MYYPDPVDAVRKVAGHLRDGGLIVFQEFDIANCRSVPPAPAFDRHVGWIMQAFNAIGARTQLGLELYSVFIARACLALRCGWMPWSVEVQILSHMSLWQT